MPHLDEGALWMRATAPYTISFDEASKLSPQIRDILRSFPQVTTVANELGRPDDGTDPTGFFNNEFYIGLKPYGDSAWQGAISTKKQLVDAINAKMSAFPGVIFNYTQPAEDAVDEAETGLKSLLAVKIFGGDLATLEENAKKVKRIISQGSGHRRHHRGSRAGPAQPDRRSESGEDRPLSGSTWMMSTPSSRPPSGARPLHRSFKGSASSTFWSACRSHSARTWTLSRTC